METRCKYAAMFVKRIGIVLLCCAALLGQAARTDLRGTWRWTSGRNSGTFQISAQNPDGTFSGRFGDRPDDGKSPLSGRLTVTGIEFNRTILRDSVQRGDPGGDQLWKAQLSGTSGTLRMINGTWRGYSGYGNSGSGDFQAERTDSSTGTPQPTPPPVKALSVSVSPAQHTMQAGQQVTTTAQVTGGAFPYKYQWFDGANQSRLTASGVRWPPSSPGTHVYKVVVTDAAGQQAEAQSTVVVQAAPPLTTSVTTPGGMSVQCMATPPPTPVSCVLAHNTDFRNSYGTSPSGQGAGWSMGFPRCKGGFLMTLDPSDPRGNNVQSCMLSTNVSVTNSYGVSPSGQGSGWSFGFTCLANDWITFDPLGNTRSCRSALKQQVNNAQCLRLAPITVAGNGTVTCPGGVDP